MKVGLDARKLTEFGIGSYVAALLKGLDRRKDIELVALVKEQQVPRAERLAPKAEIVPVSASEYSIYELMAVPMAFRGRGLDIVHIPHWVYPPALPSPTVVTIHDIIQLLYPPQRKTALAVGYLRFMMKRALRKAAMVITVSRSSKRDLVRLFRAQADRIVVIPNGVDPELSERPSAEELEGLKARYGLRPPLVLVVGNDKPHKNVSTALRAYHLAVRREGLPGQLVLVGGFAPGGAVEARAKAMGIGDRVRCLGRVPGRDLVCLYHASAILLHVALYEGFGLPILEAMAAGLPVITSNVGAMRELGGDVAVLVHPMDVGEIASALAEVMFNDPMRRRMAEAGRQRAAQLTWSASVEQTVMLYRKVARQQ